MAAVFTEINEAGDGQLHVYTYPPETDDAHLTTSVLYLSETFTLLLTSDIIRKTTHLIISGTWVYGHNITEEDAERERTMGVRYVAEMIKAAGSKLESFTWCSDVPFGASILASLPFSLKDLDLNFAIPIEDVAGTQSQPGLLTIDDLLPLASFRNLRNLRIVGMKDSLQPIIWQVVWANPGLEELSLGMAQVPVTRAINGVMWPVIDKHWSGKSKAQGSSEYLGTEGDGTLNHSYGHGEYLDAVAIRKARSIVASYVDHNLDQLPLRTFRLAGFVLDEMPFRQFFGNLDCLELYAGCVDAGFALPEHLALRVHMIWGGCIDDEVLMGFPGLADPVLAKAGDVAIVGISSLSDMMGSLEVSGTEEDPEETPRPVTSRFVEMID